MDRFVIAGGRELQGRIAVSGAKNSALPALAACLLTGEPVHLQRIPRVKDIRTMMGLLSSIGATVEEDAGAVRVHTKGAVTPEAPYELVKTMRASSLVLGPLVARHGRARVSMPGGCAIGARPINLHVQGLEHLGAQVSQSHGYIEAVAPQGGLRGATVHFDRITVTGTEDLMMAAVLARGVTVLENAAREPEVQDLAALLNKMGARVEGAGTSTIRIEGVEELHGAEHSIIADRIEAGTFLIAGAMAGGDVTVSGCEPEHLTALLAKLRQAGVNISAEEPGELRVRRSGGLRATDITTEEHPGFPTDLQAQYLALMTQADGISFVTETIFENRFMHAPELQRMGASIRIEGRQAIVAGPRPLSGAQVMSSDLRASASLVIAGLVASGETVVDRVYHLDRGYERMEEKLAGVGARDPEGIMKHSEGFLAIVNDAKQRIQEVDVAGYQAWVAEDAAVVLIDTREESEWAAGHAAGAVHLSKGIIERDVEKTVPDAGTRMVLYCGGGYRSALAADNLQKMGYTNVYSLAGGWRAWLEAAMPVEK